MAVVPPPVNMSGLRVYCYCGQSFWTMRGYAWHYRTFHG